MINVAWFVIGAIFGTVMMIVVSVIAVSGRQSDEEYRRELEQMKEHGIDKE